MSVDNTAQDFALFAIESIMQQYNDISAKRERLNEKLNVMRGHMGTLAREAGISLPIHTPYGTLRKFYANERYARPFKYHILAEKPCGIRRRGAKVV